MEGIGTRSYIRGDITAALLMYGGVVPDVPLFACANVRRRRPQYAFLDAGS